MRSRRQRKTPMSEINVVPYIDVMLVLLVIFMITAPMLTQGISVELPKAVSENIESSDREPIIVSVNEAGSYFLNIDDNPGVPISPKSLVLRVAAELQIAKESNKKVHVLVKGDREVPYGKIVIAMSLLKQAGSEQVGLITESPLEEQVG